MRTAQSVPLLHIGQGWVRPLGAQVCGQAVRQRVLGPEWFDGRRAAMDAELRKVPRKGTIECQQRPSLAFGLSGVKAKDVSELDNRKALSNQQ